jgi:hypothetical protein
LRIKKEGNGEKKIDLVIDVIQFYAVRFRYCGDCAFSLLWRLCLRSPRQTATRMHGMRLIVLAALWVVLLLAL